MFYFVEYLVMEVEAGKAKLRCPNHVDCHVNHLSSSLHDEKVIARFDTNVGRSWVYAMKVSALFICTTDIYV